MFYLAHLIQNEYSESIHQGARFSDSQWEATVHWKAPNSFPQLKDFGGYPCKPNLIFKR